MRQITSRLGDYLNQRALQLKLTLLVEGDLLIVWVCSGVTVRTGSCVLSDLAGKETTGLLRLYGATLSLGK